MHAVQKLRLGPISPAAPGPLYQQIIDAVKREVAAGRFAPGAPLPSFRALAEELLVSLITVKRAYDELEREGVIYRHQGLGTFIAEGGVGHAQTAQEVSAQDAMRAAVAAARAAGLADDEVTRMLRKELASQKRSRP